MYHFIQKKRELSSCRLSNQKGEGKRAIPERWSNIQKNKLEELLFALTNYDPYGLLGINIYNTDFSDSKKFEYIKAVARNLIQLMTL